MTKKKKSPKPPQCTVCAGQHESVIKFPIRPSAIKKINEDSYAIMEASTTLEGGILAYGNKVVKVVSKKKVVNFRKWLRALKYFNYQCAYCEKSLEKDLTRDHFIPKSLGGAKYGVENIVPCCSKCNNAKADIHPVDWCTEAQLEKIYAYIWDLRLSFHGHKVEWKAISIRNLEK